MTGFDEHSGVVLHIPHASRDIPADVRETFVLSDRELDAELLRMTDAFTDELFQLDNSPRVVFPVSRLVVDPERFVDDSQEPMASKGMGAVYVRTAGGRALRTQGGWSRDALLRRYYEPHHQALREAVTESLDSQGECLVVDCHSFPAAPLPYEDDQNTDRPDICIGTDPHHTPEDLVECIEEAAQIQGLSVEIDRPFAGAMVPAPFYRSHGAVFAVMIEVNRSLYMDEATGEKAGSFDEAARKVGALLLAIEDWRQMSFFDRLTEQGKELGYQEWDSGGPGAGAGCIYLYDYFGKYILTHDAGFDIYDSPEIPMDFVVTPTDATTSVVIHDDEEPGV